MLPVVARDIAFVVGARSSLSRSLLAAVSPNNQAVPCACPGPSQPLRWTA